MKKNGRTCALASVSGQSIFKSKLHFIRNSNMKKKTIEHRCPIKLAYVQNCYSSGAEKKHRNFKAAEFNVVILGIASLNVIIFLLV